MVLKSYIISTKFSTIFKLKNKLKLVLNFSLVLNERYIFLTDINVVHKDTNRAGKNVKRYFERTQVHS